ncbi:MAG: DUF4870 domain-containing protein [Planctomycetota bacterium]|nr:DUF4870 domain-containing protein [Planctomycetota bacterium]
MAEEQAASGVTADEKQWGMLAHLLVLSGYIIPFGNFIAPVVVFFMKKDESKFVKFHALQSIFLQLALFVVMLILMIPIIILTFITAGLATLLMIPLFGLIGIGLLIYVIMIGLKANKGELARYYFVGDIAYKKVYEGA